MGVVRFYEIYCDAEDERNCVNNDGYMEPYLSDVRKHLRKLGWLMDKTGDWCPAHRPDRQERGEQT